jgi:hypothetical protein
VSELDKKPKFGHEMRLLAASLLSMGVILLWTRFFASFLPKRIDRFRQVRQVREVRRPQRHPQIPPLRCQRERLPEFPGLLRPL